MTDCTWCGKPGEVRLVDGTTICANCRETIYDSHDHAAIDGGR